MNYLFVLHTIQCGGAEKYIINLANALSEQNSDDRVFLYIYDDSTFYLDLIKPTVTTIRNNQKQNKLFTISWYFSFYIKFGLKLVWQTRKIKYDYILSGYEELSEFAIFFVRLFNFFRGENIKYVSFIHNTFRYFESRRKTVFYIVKSRFIDSIRLRLFNVFFVVSNQIKSEFLEKYPNKTCEVLSPIINEVEKYSVTKNNDVNAGLPYVIYVGRINRAKNLRFLIDVFDILKDEKIMLYVFGNIEDTVYYQEVEEHIEKLKLTNRIIIYKTAVQNIYTYMRKAKALVVSSKNEGFPLNIIEAMNYNIPVISTPFPGSHYLEGKGFLLKTFDVKEFANTIDALLENEYYYTKEMQDNVGNFLIQFKGHTIVNEFLERLL